MAGTLKRRIGTRDQTMPHTGIPVYRCRGLISIGRRAAVLMVTACLWLTGCMPDSFIITPISANRALTQEVLYKESLFPDGKIAVVDVDGVIVNANRVQFLFGRGASGGDVAGAVG